ncbi:MAG: hypothetical protein HYY84_19380 [Deltaproteobacteria bacterium]|nr:hypothetical protein [Deltaproteobacteria bacterium]
MPAGRYVPIESTRARLYVEPSWEDATKQPGERFRLERGVGTLRPLLVSVTTVPASEFKTIKDVLDAREAAFGKSVVRERVTEIRVSGAPAEKRAVRIDVRGETWATFLYGFTLDRDHVVIQGFAKTHLANESEADFDALVAAIQLMTPEASTK